MTTSLTTYTQSTRAVGVPGGRGEMTSSLNTSGVEFTERALTWTDVAPASIADRASSRVIGCEASSLPLGTYSRISQILDAVRAEDATVQEALSRAA